MFRIQMLSYKCCRVLLALFYRKNILKFCDSGAAASIIDLLRLEQQFYRIIVTHGICKYMLKVVGYLAYLNMKCWKQSLPQCMKVHCNSGQGQYILVNFMLKSADVTNQELACPLFYCLEEAFALNQDIVIQVSRWHQKFLLDTATQFLSGMKDEYTAFILLSKDRLHGVSSKKVNKGS